MQVVNCEQNTAEWEESRIGKITASEFKSVLAKGQGKTRRKYMMQLAGELVTGRAAGGYYNEYMKRGHEQEDYVVSLYEEATGLKVDKCGFMYEGSFGYSPDGLVGNDGAIEIKTKEPHLQAEVLLADKVPSEHIAQLQGGLYVSKRKWIDFNSYCPAMPLFTKRVERDEKYIANLEKELKSFEKELQEIVKQIMEKF